ncbi:hypothetical protein CMU16_14730 [Elizabethkingia anophelis]|nr:hypothetical protein [Elizabethkingia anophelis]
MSEIIEKKINYWKDLWGNLINDFLKKSYGLNLYTPHTLVEDIILEIEEENKNVDNWKYFKSKLEHYLSNDTVLKNYFQSDFKILRSILHTNKTNLILELCKSLKRRFNKGEYFDKNLKELKKIILNNDPLNENSIILINNLTQNLIVELIKKGYVLKDIKRFINEIFATYELIPWETECKVKTAYPHNMLENYNINDETDRKRFNEDLIKTIDSLTYEDRIDKLSYFYYKEAEEAYYVFVIEGLKGNSELSIGDVTFYSPDEKRFAEKDFFNDEDLQKNNTEKFIQASVKVKYLSLNSSFSNAVSTLEKSIDLLHCYYNTKYKIEINLSEYIVIKDGEIIHNSWNNNDSILKYNNSLDIDKFKENMKSLDGFVFREENKTISKLSAAVHWYSKAENSLKQEDKILNYWIAIENLFSSELEILRECILDKNSRKAKFIQYIISSNQIPSFIYDYGWEMYHHYSRIARNKFLNKDIELPDELIKKANLDIRDGDVFLKKFVDSLNDIRKYEKNQFLSEKLKKLNDFYSNNSIAKKIVEEQIKLIEEDVLMIYRFRNLIVHNAHFDNTLLPQYVWKAREYSGNLIRKLLLQFKNDKINLSSLLINIYLKREKLLNELKSNTANLFSEES